MCCDNFYLLELTLKTQVSDTLISVTVAVAVTTDVQSVLHQHARRLTDEYPLIHCRTDNVVTQVAPLLYQWLQQVVDVTNY